MTTKKIKGMFDTEIYTREDGYVAIRQGDDAAVVLFAPDDLLVVIRELQAFYDTREQWQEPTRG